MAEREKRLVEQLLRLGNGEPATARRRLSVAAVGKVASRQGATNGVAAE
jgi:hypothetical protein